MKIIRINKKFRNGTKEHFLVLMDESYSYDEIDIIAEEWCESELSGMNYGYSYEWWFVEDIEIINTVVWDKINIINERIEILEAEKCEMKKFIYK